MLVSIDPWVGNGDFNWARAPVQIGRSVPDRGEVRYRPVRTAERGPLGRMTPMTERVSVADNLHVGNRAWRSRRSGCYSEGSGFESQPRSCADV